MKIVFRTSGGRGEYELAGRQGKSSVVDLAGYHFDFQVSPYILVPGKCTLQINGGKPRLRLADADSAATHAYRWLSALLLLQKPNRVRTENAHHATTVDFSAGYQVSGIRVDITSLEKDQGYCQLRPTILELHQGNINESLSIPERVSRIQAVLGNLGKLPPQVAEALGKFEEAFSNPGSHKKLEQLRDAVYATIESADANVKAADVLPYLEALIGGLEVGTEGEAAADVAEEGSNGEDDQRSEIQIRADYVRAWRKVTERGYKGRQFSKSVLEAYNSRCLISGRQLPRTRANTIPGVDAAHILPWANYDLDQVNNGVCLAKTYHWAFDAGILRIQFDPKANTYLRLIDTTTRKILVEDGFDLTDFDQHLGAIPFDRLPKQKSLWPEPKFLEEFNKLLSTA
jgi:hypothetical protein